MYPYAVQNKEAVSTFETASLRIWGYMGVGIDGSIK
jgi:hypothetical protein